MSVNLLGSRYWSPKVGSCLRPASEFDEKKLAGVREGKAVFITIVEAVNPKLPQFYWALVSKLVDGGCFAGRDEAHTELMVRCGRVDSALVSTVGNTNTVRMTPMSTKEWCASHWRSYLEAVVPVITADILPDMKWSRFREEVERFVGIRLSDAMKEC